MLQKKKAKGILMLTFGRVSLCHGILVVSQIIAIRYINIHSNLSIIIKFKAKKILLDIKRWLIHLVYE